MEIVDGYKSATVGGTPESLIRIAFEFEMLNVSARPDAMHPSNAVAMRKVLKVDPMSRRSRIAIWVLLLILTRVRLLLSSDSSIALAIYYQSQRKMGYTDQLSGFSADATP